MSIYEAIYYIIPIIVLIVLNIAMCYVVKVNADDIFKLLQFIIALISILYIVLPIAVPENTNLTLPFLIIMLIMFIIIGILRLILSKIDKKEK